MELANEFSAIVESRRRHALAERRASLVASLGPAPTPVRLRPFARRVTPLLRTVEIQHPAVEVPARPRAA